MPSYQTAVGRFVLVDGFFEVFATVIMASLFTRVSKILRTRAGIDVSVQTFQESLLNDS